MKNYTELHVYDFDGTLFGSPVKPADWTGGWWGKSLSLELPFVPETPSRDWYNDSVVASAKISQSRPEVLSVLMTGRIPKLAGRVKQILEFAGLSFSEYHFCNTNGTEAFKKAMMQKILEDNPSIKRVCVWEDRHTEEYKVFLDSLDIDNEVIVVPTFSKVNK
jgi:hypothetical protein